MANLITAGNGTNNGLAITSDNTGALNILTGSGSGTAAISIDSSQNVTMASNLSVTGTLTATNGITGSLKSATAQASTSGTSIDFTSIPSGVKRITVMFSAVSLSSTANLLVRGGVGGAIDDAGYASASIGSNGAGSGGISSSTSGYIMRLAGAGASCSGHMVLTLLGSNTWVSSHSGTYDASTICIVGGGTNTFSGTLDTIRITTTSTDTFDAGSINILYE
jgi:hypothetical protein